jgi:hypothetical protein
MGLGDWTIVVRYMPYLESRGLTSVWIKSKRAIIEIHEPAAWPTISFRLTVEQTFLHEMGHVQLARLEIPSDGPHNVHEEQIVEAYANALYAAKYDARS